MGSGGGEMCDGGRRMGMSGEMGRVRKTIINSRCMRLCSFGLAFRGMSKRLSGKRRTWYSTSMTNAANRAPPSPPLQHPRCRSCYCNITLRSKYSNPFCEKRDLDWADEKTGRDHSIPPALSSYAGTYALRTMTVNGMAIWHALARRVHPSSPQKGDSYHPSWWRWFVIVLC